MRYLPTGDGVSTIPGNTVSVSDVFSCPANGRPFSQSVFRTDFGINYRHTFGFPAGGFGATQKWNQIHHPTTTIVLCDGYDYNYCVLWEYYDGGAYGFNVYTPAYRHPNKTANFCMFDGHIESGDRFKYQDQYVWWAGLN